MTHVGFQGWFVAVKGWEKEPLKFTVSKILVQVQNPPVSWPCRGKG